MNNKMVKILFFLSITLLLSSCSMTHTSFISELSLPQQQKQKTPVKLIANKPKQDAFRVGYIVVSGSSIASHKTLLKAVEKKAAVVGGDFILLETSSCNVNKSKLPAYLRPKNGMSCFQTSKQSLSKDSEEYDFPWACFSVWAYTPANLGLKLDNMIITGFHVHSDAEKAGVYVGDELLGIDEYDVSDQQLLAHLMELSPGDSVKLHVRHNGKKSCHVITALKNS